jgi:hypothetical protein
MTHTVADAIRHAPFKLFGLDRLFDGPRLVRSWELDIDGLPTMISLAHGLPADDTSDAPVIEVGVRQRNASIDILDTLTEALVASTYLVVSGGFEEWRRETLRTVGDWTPTTVSVAGRECRFRRRGFADHWVAVAEIGACWLFVHSRQMPRFEVRLDVINVELYIAGSGRYGANLGGLTT